MTCIVGIEDKDGVWMGGDSAAIAGYDRLREASGKVFRRGPFLCGYTTSFRMGQVLRHQFDPPIVPAKLDLASVDAVQHFMVTDFIERWRQCSKSFGYTQIENNREESGCFLIGFAGFLFRIHDDFQRLRNIDGYAAVGSGEPFALGAFHASWARSAEERCRMALEAAEYHNAGVSAPLSYHYVARDDQ